MAAKYYGEAVKLQPENPQYLNAAGHDGLHARALRRRGTLLKQSLGIRKKALGPEHPDVATSLNNLAVLYSAQGLYAKAEPLYQRALAIWKKALGPEHPDVATSLNNLAALYQAQGRYAEAEPLYQRRSRSGEGARPRASGRGREPQQPGGALPRPGPLRRGRAALPAGAGDLGEGARPRASATWPRASTTWRLYHAQGRYAEAEPLYQRALAICEKALGPEHPDVATSLNNLAVLY